MIINTQDSILLNIDRITQIMPLEVQIEDVTAYCIVASSQLIPAEEFENPNEAKGTTSRLKFIQLGIYHTQNECEAVFEQILAALRAGMKTYVMPFPDELDDVVMDSVDNE